MMLEICGETRPKRPSLADNFPPCTGENQRAARELMASGAWRWIVDPLGWCDLEQH